MRSAQIQVQTQLTCEAKKLCLKQLSLLCDPQLSDTLGLII